MLAWDLPKLVQHRLQLLGGLAAQILILLVSEDRHDLLPLILDFLGPHGSVDLVQRTQEHIPGIPIRTLDIADRPVALVNEFRRELQVKMIPGPHCTIRKSLMILVSTDLGEFGYIDVHDRLTLNERIQGISNSLELFIKPAELPDRMNNAVLDEHHVAHGTDEVVAAGAIELTPLPEDLISSCRETVQVQLPQDILVDGHLVDMLSILTEFREVILDCFLEIYEINC